MINSIDEIKSIHFVGIGGVSMSKLCSYCVMRGLKCSGSDAKRSRITDALVAMGVHFNVGEGRYNARHADLIVYSGAIDIAHPDILCAKVAIERREFLKIFASDFNVVVAVSGAHGKTTTASMISWILREVGYPFTAHIGGSIVGVDPLCMNYGRDILVIEACEYRRSFLTLMPDIAVILNIDYDHPDCYSSIEEVYNAFGQFASQSRCVVHNAEYPIKSLAQTTSGDSLDDIEFINYSNIDSTSCADYLIKKVTVSNGSLSMQLVDNSSNECNPIGEFALPTYNPVIAECATASIIACLKIGVELDTIIRSLATFAGVTHRYQCMGRKDCGAKVIADYSHHPKEIRKVLEATRLNSSERIVAVFQPHTYSRTKALLKEFVASLSLADLVVVMATYSAREQESDGINSVTLYQELCRVNVNAIYLEDYDDVDNYIDNNCIIGDTVLYLGAGIDLDRIIVP